MHNTNKRLYHVLIVFTVLFLHICCNGKGKQHSEPILRIMDPVYDDATKTFSLTVMADSTDDAILTFFLTEGGNTIQESQSGIFRGISPLEDGYDLIFRAQWKDTVIEKNIHVMDFVVPDEPVTKMTMDELERLINNRDRASRQIIYNHLTQNAKLIVKDSNNQSPQVLSDVFTLLANDLWQSVRVIEMEYNSFNLISCITLRAVGEKNIK